MPRHNPEQLPLDGLTIPSTSRPVELTQQVDGGDVLPKLSEVIAEEPPDGPLCFSLTREMSDVPVLARFTVDGEPVSKQRPRFAKGRNGHVYTPGGTTAAEKVVGWNFKKVCKRVPSNTQGFGLYVGFFCGSGQRRDVDNMLKLVLDGLNGVAFADDSQVVEVSAKLTRWDPDPRTEVVVYLVPQAEHPSRICPACGRTFDIYPSTTANQKYCSKKCRSEHSRVSRICAHCGGVFTVKASRASSPTMVCSPQCRADRDRTTRPCRQCGEPFTVPNSWATKSALCSTECRTAWAAAHPTRSTRGGKCAVCGNKTSRPEYVRCGTCRAANRTPA